MQSPAQALRPVIAAGLTAVMILSVACTAEKENKRAKPAVPVKTASAVQKDVPVQIRAIGTIEAFTSVEIKSQVSGQIARVHFTEGSEVTKGALLVSIDPEPFQAALAQAEATLARDQAQTRFAVEQTKRYEGLLKDGIVTHDQYEQLRANAESFAATVVSDRAAVRNARIQLGYCSIRSPISGRTGTITLKPGNLVKANEQTIVVVNQLSPIHVTFSLPENRLAEIRRGMASQLKIQAIIPGQPGATESGTISFMDNAVNPATGTIRLKGVFANRAHKLWPGQFTDIILTLASRQNAVVVPTTAIQTGQQGEFVFVVKTDNRVEMRPITSGVASGDETVIEKGLTAGETVVTDGQLRLTPGALVEAKGQQPAGNIKQ